jgi:WD40 repeat protein
MGACDNKTTDIDDGDGTPPPISPVALRAEGQGAVAERFTAEVWVVGNVAYTTTWGSRTLNGVRSPGNAVKIWDVSGATPALIDSLIVPEAITLGDVQASDDGKLLVVATEDSPGSIVIYDLADPRKPQLISRFTSANTNPGVHTAEVQRVNGKLYAFLCVDPADTPARLVIVDITNPGAPTEVLSKEMGDPFVHDVFVRDGILMVALWNDGMSIFDIGGGARGGTVANPVLLGNVKTLGGNVHNIWWYHDPSDGSKRFAFVGEEGPGSLGSSAQGDIHVVDVSDLTKPREVAFYSVAGAGTHNFSVDESRGVLFAAFYNAGVRALNVRGNLGACPSSMKTGGRCDLRKVGREVGEGLTNTGAPVFVWGVQSVGTKLFASDMLNGLWKLETIP